MRWIPILLLLAALPSADAQSTPKLFSALHPDARTIPLPESVRASLEQHPEVAGRMAANAPPLTHLPDDWTLCYRVTLGPPDEIDYLVQGSPPFTGANVVPFWLYRIVGDLPRLVLFTGGLTLQVRRHRTHGLHEIRTAAVALQRPTRATFRFDGATYQPIR